MNWYLVGQTLGYITAGINFVLYLPQVIHVYQLKDTISLNSHFLILQMASCATTFGYGAVLNEYPLMISSTSIFLSAASLGYAKWILFKPSNETGYTVVNETLPLQSNENKKTYMNV